jgi:hypothetical protein
VLTDDDFKDKNNMSPLQSAKDRARFIYQIMLKLAKSDDEVSPIPKLLECGTTRDDVSVSDKQQNTSDQFDVDLFVTPYN